MHRFGWEIMDYLPEIQLYEQNILRWICIRLGEGSISWLELVIFILKSWNRQLRGQFCLSLYIYKLAKNECMDSYQSWRIWLRPVWTVYRIYAVETTNFSQINRLKSFEGFINGVGLKSINKWIEPKIPAYNLWDNLDKILRKNENNIENGLFLMKL